MTDLQIGLALIGLLAVVAVLVYNRWQERSVRRDAERAFASGHADVLVDAGERREPTLEPRRAPPAPGVTPAHGVDYVIQVAFPNAQAGLTFGEGWKAAQSRFAGRAFLAPGEAPERLRAALQLVSRSGVVSDAELLEFRSAVETLAAKARAKVDAPEMRAALEAARELDRTCAEVDIQIALHVVGVDPRSLIAEGQPFQAAAREDGVTLTLDVARTPQPTRSYEAMARAGQQLARDRGGRLVDDAGRELDERALASIAAQLDAVGQRLAGCGIEPGSPLALRVFS